MVFIPGVNMFSGYCWNNLFSTKQFLPMAPNRPNACTSHGQTIEVVIFILSLIAQLVYEWAFSLLASGCLGCPASTPGPWFNIKMSSYQYRKSHCGDKTILRPSYLHNGISYTGKMTSLYWIGALVSPENDNSFWLEGTNELKKQYVCVSVCIYACVSFCRSIKI